LWMILRIRDDASDRDEVFLAHYINKWPASGCNNSTTE
jgi:hypothetical protein